MADPGQVESIPHPQIPNLNLPRLNPRLLPAFVAMAAAIKAINAKIRSNKVADYVCSTRTFPAPQFFPRVSRRASGTEIGQL